MGRADTFKSSANARNSMASKDPSSVAAKWASRAAVSTGDYSAGVRATGDWQSKTAASNDSWKQGVSKAVSNDSFSKGVSATSNSDWQSAAASASGDWSSGISAARSDFQNQIGKVMSSAASASLDVRGPRGSASNYNRSRQVGEKLHADKEAGAFR